MAKDKTKKKNRSRKTPISKMDVLEGEIRRLNHTMRKRNNYYKRSQVIIRGLIQGIFTALGATIGFTLVILILASFIRTISAVPFINNILDQTGISRIIEYQLDEIEQVDTTPTPTPENPTNNTD
ncbi:MAG: DUF5665 domain-containing protein [Candidatus Dojkabacteria bacterium]